MDPSVTTPEKRRPSSHPDENGGAAAIVYTFLARRCRCFLDTSKEYLDNAWFFADTYPHHYLDKMK